MRFFFLSVYLTNDVGKSVMASQLRLAIFPWSLHAQG